MSRTGGCILACEEKLMQLVMASTQLDFCWQFSRGIFEHVVDEMISLGELVTVQHFGDERLVSLPR